MRGARMLQRGRRVAEERMSETIAVGWLVDGTDDNTGDPIQTVETPVYDGPARIRWASSTVSDMEGAGEQVAVQRPVLSVPVGSPRLFDGMGVSVTGSTADGLLVGRVFGSGRSRVGAGDGDPGSA